MTRKCTIYTTGPNFHLPVLAECGGLVIHENINAAAQDGWKYALSHADSGRHLAAFRSRGEAAGAMRAIAPLLPWSGPRAGIVEAASLRLRCKTWGLIRRFGGYREDDGRAMRAAQVAP